MSLFSQREQIAIAAMQGLLTATDPEKEIPYRDIAKMSSCMANAMMKELGIHEPAPQYTNGFLPTVD